MAVYFFRKVGLSCRSNSSPWRGSGIIVIGSVNLNLVDFFYHLLIGGRELESKNENCLHLWTTGKVLQVSLSESLSSMWKRKRKAMSTNLSRNQVIGSPRACYRGGGKSQSRWWSSWKPRGRPQGLCRHNGDLWAPGRWSPSEVLSRKQVTIVGDSGRQSLSIKKHPNLLEVSEWSFWSWWLHSIARQASRE